MRISVVWSMLRYIASSKINKKTLNVHKIWVFIYYGKNGKLNWPNRARTVLAADLFTVQLKEVFIQKFQKSTESWLYFKCISYTFCKLVEVWIYALSKQHIELRCTHKKLFIAYLLFLSQRNSGKYLNANLHDIFVCCGCNFYLQYSRCLYYFSCVDMNWLRLSAGIW